MSESKGFIKHIPVVSGLTFLSRILGLIRDATFAAAFGAGWEASAYSIAFQIPNLFRRLFGEGALSSAFIPVFSQVHHNGERDRAVRLAGTILFGTALLLGVLVVIGEGVTFGLMPLVEPTDRNDLTLRLTAIMLPYAILVCGVALLGGLLNVLGHFAAPAAAPIVLNLVIIGAIGLGVATPDATITTRLSWVGMAVLIAGVLQLLLQWLAVRAKGFRIRPALDLRDEAVRRIALLTGPMVIGLAAVQINTLADSLIAYWFVPHGGAPNKLYLAQRLYQFPLGVFLIALATAIYPQFSKMAAERDMDGFGESVVRGLRMALFIGLPASVGLILMREPLVGLLFERGLFERSDTVRTATVLLFYAAGIWAYGLQMMLARAFYALQDSKTPVRIAMAMVVLNVTLNLVLVRLLPEPEERGLALATAICAAIQSSWLAWVLARRVGELPWALARGQAVRVVVATAIMTLACLGVSHLAGESRAVQVVAILLAGAGSYAAASWLLRIDELDDLIARR